MTSDDRKGFAWERARMVEQQLAARGIDDPAVLDAMGSVPREAFVPERFRHLAYADTPIPIFGGQTVSQPYVVAHMLQELNLTPTGRVLEIGTGSGYAAAVLSRLAQHVYTVECIDTLADEAAARLAELGYANVTILWGDGTLGWPEHAPYDGIVVAAGGPKVPAALKAQLALGGRLVLPVGRSRTRQQLLRVERTGPERFTTTVLSYVAFVPLVGQDGWHDDDSGADDDWL